ncbi:18074_t:CDS:1, partial [Entrophospora sp. SA101]
IWALENWARNKNVIRKLNKENINLLFDAANELMTKPGIEGLEWVIDGWQKYLDLTVLSDDDSTIKSDDDDDIVDITKNISIQDNNHLIGLLIVLVWEQLRNFFQKSVILRRILFIKSFLTSIC